MAFVLVSIEDDSCTLRIPFRPVLERPGGIIAGHVCMAAADVSMWLAIKARYGDESSLTSSMVNFNRVRSLFTVNCRLSGFKTSMLHNSPEVHISTRNRHKNQSGNTVVLDNAKRVEPLLRLFVRDRRGRVIHVPLSDITRLVGADDYVEVHVGNSSYFVNITLTEFERRLDPNRFRRVHRSAIVNLDKIVKCKLIDRRVEIELKDGSRVVASRAGSQHLRDLFV